jgi:hypothetical protein
MNRGTAQPEGPGDYYKERDRMIRNLKVLLLSAMALAAFGALSAGAAHAAEEFHCSVKPCTITANQDGAAGSVTGSQLFIPKNKAGETASFKCGAVSGGATSEGTTTPELTVGAAGLLAYSSCKVNGSSTVNYRTNECHYLFTAEGGGSTEGATVHILCKTAKHIEREIPETGCILETTPQTLTGVHYHNIGTSGTNSTEVTVEVKVSGVAVEVKAVGTGCLPKAAVGETLTATLTGNLLVTAEKDNSNKEMVEGWWA